MSELYKSTELITLPTNEYAANDNGLSYMMSKSPERYSCYRKTTYSLPTAIVDSFVHQILFCGPTGVNELSGWIISISEDEDEFLSEFVPMALFESLIMKLRSRSEDQYTILTRWLEITRQLAKNQQYEISQTLHRDGKPNDMQLIREAYAEHALAPLYFDGAKSSVYFIINRLLSDIIHTQEFSQSWCKIIERGFEIE